MTDAPLSFVTSPDGSSWSNPQNIVNGYSDYGLQMHVYRGELYGIMTQTVQYPRQMFATKYKIDSGWKSWVSLPEWYLAQGRVSVTVLEDRFYILRRGTNDAVYLCWTDDFQTFNDAGRVGSQYAKTKVSPAICAHDGLLYITGVGEDNYIYYTVADKSGKRLQSWKKIDGTGTQSALSMAIYDGKLFLFHTGWNNDRFFYQYLGDDDNWSSLENNKTNITSGLSAVSWKYNTLVVTYRGKDEDIKWNAFDGKKWTGKQYVPDVYMKYQTGLATWGGRLVVSYAASKNGNEKRFGYKPRAMIMNEKNGAFGQVEEVEDEWNCKWDQNTTEDKSWVKKMFCL